MNLYLRYFDNEYLATSIDDALNFLCSIDEIEMNQELEEDIRNYANSSILYPKRYKVHQHSYFIIIKSEATTMEEFKSKKMAASTNPAPSTPSLPPLDIETEGWYEGDLTFKRVTIVPGTQKCQYKDVRFVVRCKAMSGHDCYNRIVAHLSERVDPRSQFPAAKGKYFKFSYLGAAK